MKKTQEWTEFGFWYNGEPVSAGVVKGEVTVTDFPRALPAGGEGERAAAILAQLIQPGEILLITRGILVQLTQPGETLLITRGPDD